MALIFGNEGFEGTGYEETWSEGESGAGAVDEDYATSNAPNAPSNWQTQCLRAVVGGGDNAEVGHDFGSALGTAFVRAEFIWVAEAFPGTNESVVIVQGLSGAGVHAWSFRLNEQSSGVYRTQFSYTNDGSFHSTFVAGLALGEPHRAEVMWDNAGDAFEFRLDGTTAVSGSITTQRDFQIIRAGVTSTAPSNSQEVLLDNIAIDDADWPGAFVPPGGGVPHHLVHVPPRIYTRF